MANLDLLTLQKVKQADLQEKKKKGKHSIPVSFYPWFKHLLFQNKNNIVSCILGITKVYAQRIHQLTSECAGLFQKLLYLAGYSSKTKLEKYSIAR